jgi:hypothetical protein
MSDKKRKWSYEAYVLYLNYFLQNNTPSFINTESSFVNNICIKLNEQFANFTFSPNEFLSNLFDLYNTKKGKVFLNPIVPNGNLKLFYSSIKKEFGIKLHDLKRGLIACILYLREIFNKGQLLLSYNYSLSLEKNIHLFIETYHITKLEILADLFQQNILILDTDNKFTIKNGEHNMNKNSPLDYDLNMARKDIASVFNHKDSSFNLYLLNDGTGSGKTHNVVINFIEQYPNLYDNNSLNHINRKSLIFIAPQKNQLFANENVYLNAEKNQIPLLFSRSQDDLTNLNSFIYLNFDKETNSFSKTKKFFENLLAISNLEKKQIDGYLRALYSERMKIKKDENFNLDDEQNKEKHENKIPSIFSL